MAIDIQSLVKTALDITGDTINDIVLDCQIYVIPGLYDVKTGKTENKVSKIIKGRAVLVVSGSSGGQSYPLNTDPANSEYDFFIDGDEELLDYSIETLSIVFDNNPKRRKINSIVKKSPSVYSMALSNDGK